MLVRRRPHLSHERRDSFFALTRALLRRPAEVNQQSRRALFDRLRAANPHPTSELHYATPFELLVAVVLSAQATDKGVNRVTSSLFAKANTPETMYALGEAQLRSEIRTLGLFNTKARNLIKTCQLLMERFEGQVPADRAALESLPGVGRKTANVVLNTAFGEPTIAVDTHIFRVANRTGLAPGRTVQAVERRLARVVPVEFKRHAHHWLILHGRYICVARRPRCGSCVLRDLCDYAGKSSA